MNSRKNEEGYAMLLVLFLVVLIMSVSAVFMRSALSNAKQEKVVDHNHLSVVAAEMGVEYYTTLFTNEFLDVRSPKNLDIIRNKIVADADNEELTSEELLIDIKREVLKQFEIRFNKINEKPENYYPLSVVYFDRPIINNFSFFESGPHSDLEINGDIFGRYPKDFDRISRLSLNLTFALPQGSGSGTSPDPKPGEGGLGDDQLEWPEFNLTPDIFFGDGNVPTKNCKSGDDEIEGNSCIAKKQNGIEGIKNSNVYINDDFHAKSDLELENSSIYIKESLDVKGELEVEKGSRLYIGKNLHVHNNKKKGEDDEGEFEIEEKSIVYVVVSATIDGELEIEDYSSLFVGKDLDVKDDLEVKGHSTLYVGRNLKVDGELEVKKNSTVCVVGTLKVKGDIKIGESSIVYLKEHYNSSYNNKKGFEFLSNSDWKEKCGISIDSDTNPPQETEFPTIPEINGSMWESPIADVEYK